MVTKSEEFKLSDFVRPIVYVRDEKCRNYVEKEDAVQVCRRIPVVRLV